MTPRTVILTPLLHFFDIVQFLLSYVAYVPYLVQDLHQVLYKKILPKILRLTNRSSGFSLMSGCWVELKKMLI